MGEAKQPSGKCPKLSDGEQNMGSIDRLSSLPDEVICHILSFLPTKRSVATSILGKRWRFLWAHVPCLDFSGDDFKEEGTHASNSFWEEETQDSEASDIIHRVILQHKAERMDTLTLSYVKFNEYQLEAWITTAIDRSIRNLYLQLNLYTFPRSLFNCKTIVDLKLDNYRASLSAVDNVSLPSLKKLHVNNVVCENDDALPRFLSGCPLLEELNMAIYFQYDYAGCINISSPTIKKLKLDIDYSFRPFNLEYRIIINAPALRYLQVYGYDFALEWITIPITMNSLVEADIHFKNYFYPVKTDCNSMEVKFLHSLCYVKCLKISGWRLGEVSSEPMKGGSLTLYFHSMWRIWQRESQESPWFWKFQVLFVRIWDREQNMASIDNHSSYPDGIICHILSFLPTKRSVATSVLGKRWRFLWAHVPCLEFSGNDFRKEDFGEEETQSWDDFMKEGTQASNTIHGVILRHKAKRTDSLTLYNVYCDEYQLETWIKIAKDRSIRNLYLQLDLDTIPQSLFNCKTIVDLKLDNNRAPLSDVDNVSLPGLKKFYVYNVVCESDDALPSLSFRLSVTRGVEYGIQVPFVRIYMDKTKQPSGKRQKLSIREQNMGSADRLSSLPDEVICHILSFLPTKRSMATSVLGKRWRFLWAHVPSLHFDFRKRRTKASDIINRVIFRHKAKRMDTLTLDYVNRNEYQLEKLITAVIDRCLRNLYLFDLYTLPPCIFNGKTIVNLKLDICRASLPAVENNDEALPHFLSGCPSLEDLNMKFTSVEKGPFDYDYDYDSVSCINISSPTIKTLKLHLEHLTCPSNRKCKCRMILNAPALRYLQVYGHALECITVPITMISLFEADIRLRSYNTTVVNFLQCYVTCLVISGWELKEFVQRGVACSTVKFDNLTKLEIRFNFEWSLLVKFLEIADNLEVLIVPFVRIFMEETRQSSLNCQKLSDREQNMASIDRLSSLPEDVICHILSFLETKDSVAGCDFKEEGTQASDIIHTVISRHKAKRMDTLALYRIKCNEHQLETLITTAIERSIRNLYLKVKFVTVPRSLFNCKTIVDLILCVSRVSISALDNVSLPSLKKFYVYNVVCENDEALPHFLSGCPSLEELNMAVISEEEGPFDNDFVGCINISSPTIKKLKLDLFDLPYRMTINAPALRYLELDGDVLECITIPTTMISLVEADIDLLNYNTTVMKFLHSLCYVKHLVLSGWELKGVCF
ncbi:F-box family protein [Striga asiatica]|uniref:F-box family protein n=1 Tax=Striga asiatica TaxID=4170 RepID=A0A5A7QDA1_STRAF|nr:F-box family protein [Striga asiatica]